MSNSEIVITHCCRTAIGNFNGSLASLSAAQLGSTVIKHLLEISKLNNTDISEVIIGQVLTGGCGQNPARQASFHSGLPNSTPAWLINHVCGSGLKSVMLAAQSITSGNGEIFISGGQESMSQSRHAAFLRKGVKMGKAEFIDTMLSDGLTDAFSSTHMGITAENIAAKFNITRKEQDEFAYASQYKAHNAQKQGKFNQEIVTTKVKDKSIETEFNHDEFIRADVELSKLSSLKPAFQADGTVTAGNSSGINDGAAALIIMNLERAKKLNCKPLVRIASYATSGVDPQFMGTAPVSASKIALKKAGWTINDLDLIESNEAFAAQAIYVNREMGWDANKVNVNGGAIALGHPIGASGARILVTLIHEMQRSRSKRGLATLCIGGGMGVAMCIENLTI